MSLKLKALGLGLLAMIAVGAFAVMNATAETGGHFVSEVAHTEIIGVEDTGAGSTDRFEFTSHGLEGGIVCDEVSYKGTANAATVTEITVTPEYKKCHTTAEAAGTTTVHVNGCGFIFTVGKTPKEEPEGTVHVECPPEKRIEITHPNCTITISPTNNQNLKGFTYKTITTNNKHAITIDAPKPGIQLQTTYHAGICVLTGTTHTATMEGGATVRGTNTEGTAVGITARGP